MTIQASELLGQCEHVDCGESTRDPFDLHAGQTVKLDCGVSVMFDDLFQFHTYAGKLCGFPGLTSGDAQRQIEMAVAAAKRLFPNFPIERAALIPPVISHGTTLRKISPEMAKRTGLAADVKEQRVAWEMLPTVTTLAVLKATASFDSVLAIWWQEDIGYPDMKLLQGIRKLSWHDHVVDNDP